VQHNATHYNTLHRIVAQHCNTLQRTADVGVGEMFDADVLVTCPHTATHCNALQHTVTHCNTLQHTVTHCNTLHHAATRSKTPQHTATHCNKTPQQNAATKRCNKMMQRTATKSLGELITA